MPELPATGTVYGGADAAVPTLHDDAATVISGAVRDVCARVCRARLRH
jgi:hypothetical protein